MFKIGSNVISNKNKPFIIAEISANHKNNLSHLLKMIDSAAEVGASAVKIQTILPNEITLNCSDPNFIIKNRQSKWYGKKYFDIYSEAAMPLEWHKEVFKRAKENDIIAFSSPFDEKSVDFLDKLKVPCFKIASFENEHYPLISKIIQTNKPLILSLGMLDYQGINKTVTFLKKKKSEVFCITKVLLCLSCFAKKIKLDMY